MCFILGILISTLSDSQQNSHDDFAIRTHVTRDFIVRIHFPVSSMRALSFTAVAILSPQWFIIIIKVIMLKGASFSVIERKP
jgi:hypothetical protein